MSAYLHPFQFVKNPQTQEFIIKSAIQEGSITRDSTALVGGFFYPESLKQIVHEELDKFYLFLANFDIGMPQEVDNLILDYMGEKELDTLFKDGRQTVQLPAQGFGYKQI